MGARPEWPRSDTKDEIWKRYEEPLQALYDLIVSIAQALRRLPRGWWPRSVQRLVVLFLFVRAYKTAQAVYTLFLNGFHQDAESLLRSLTENGINLNYIRRKARSRAQQFADFQLIGKRDWMSMVRRTHPTLIPPHTIEKKVEKRYKRLIARKPEYKNLRKTWTRVGIEERAREGDSLNLYFYYLLACQVLHTDPRALRDYFKRGRRGRTDIGPSLAPSSKIYVVEVSYVCLLEAFGAANATFRWRKGDLSRNYKKRFFVAFKRAQQGIASGSLL